MVRVLLGTIKGGLVGGALGYAAMRLGLTTGAPAFLTYALAGFLVGLVCGKAIWRQETLWTPALKGIFGAIVLSLLYWGATKVLGGLKLPFTAALGAPDQPLAHVPVVLAPALAIVYGIFVEVDDAEKKGAQKPGAAGSAKPPASP